MARRSSPTPALGTVAGLAYALWLPADAPVASVLVLHGAGSRKENHHDVARAACAAGFAALVADLRGHGHSAGPMDGGVLDDLAALAGRLPPAPLALRGSSMGGYLALVAAASLGAAAVVAICPASAGQLRRGLRQRRFGFAADAPAVDAFLAAHDETAAAAALDVPVLLLHAEGDEVVPVAHSRAIAAVLRHPASGLVAVPGGHHGSVQHDSALQEQSLRWVRRVLRGERADAAGSSAWP